METKTWMEEELNQMEEERKALREEKDYKDFLVLGRGEHSLEFLKPQEKPREIMGKFNKKQKVFRVKYQGEEKDWPVNIRNPVYYELLMMLKAGKTQIKILVSGEQETKRYEILR